MGTGQRGKRVIQRVIFEVKAAGAVWRGWSGEHAPLVGEQEGCLPTLTQPSHAFLPILLLKALPHSEVGAQVSRRQPPLQPKLLFTGLGSEA